jgi:hypothetical protein
VLLHVLRHVYGIELDGRVEVGKENNQRHQEHIMQPLPRRQPPSHQLNRGHIDKLADGGGEHE